MDIKEIETALLNEYKKYDYLNADKEHPLIKIFVSYIKPSFLFKSEILTPIHLGRVVAKENSKDGVVSDEDLKWLYENCIGDDDFEDNISGLNRRVGFLTGTYRAWKNYDKLGNPEYFGSFGYRKLLAPEFLKEITNYDIILPKPYFFENYLSLKDQFIKCHGDDLYEVMLKNILEVYPHEYDNFNSYMNLKSGYFHELYIMKKEVFFNFCEWIFKLMFYMLEHQPDFIDPISDSALSPEQYINLVTEFLHVEEDKIRPNLKGKEFRDIAFILERVTGYYLYKLTQDKNIKYTTEQVVQTYQTREDIIRKSILDKMRANVIRK